MKHLSEGDIADYWGNGYFLVLSFVDTDNVGPENITVAGTPLDSDLLGVWMIANDDKSKVAQTLTIVTTDGENTLSQEYDLTGLTLV